jgi:hypothetical protein
MRNAIKRHPVIPFTLRYIAVHTLTYLAFGIFFMLVSRYFEHFKHDPVLNLVMKPSDALSVRLAPVTQILRGALLALVIYPFREVIIRRKSGWLKLSALLFVLTGIGAVITGPGSIEGFLYTRFSFNPFIGYPEIGLQVLAFSWLFCQWLKKSGAAVHTEKTPELSIF